MFREHAKINLKIKLTKIQIIKSMAAIISNKIFKTKFNSTLENEFYKYKNDKVGSDYFNYEKNVRLIEAETFIALE